MSDDNDRKKASKGIRRTPSSQARQATGHAQADQDTSGSGPSKLSLSLGKAKTPSPVERATAAPNGSANVDNNTGKSSQARHGANVDKPTPQQGTGKPPSPQAGRQDGVNVDNNSKAAPSPFPGSLSFPGSDNGGPSGKTDRDPSTPPGPSPATIKRIRQSKQALADRSRDLDQSAGAQPSRQSPSKHARSQTTLSKKTSSDYLNRGRLLINRYKREIGLDQEVDDFDVVEFVTWLLSLKRGLESSSWRVYRLAAYHTLMAKPDPDIEVALDMLDNDIIEGDEALETAESRLEAKPAGYRTSALKKKNFPRADFEKYMAYLQYKSRSKSAPVLTDMLVAGVYTGLRPIEWQATDLQYDRDPSTGKQYVWLYVLNAKTTNERGNGIIRTLDLSELPVPILNSIKRMHERGLSWREAGTFNTEKSQLGQLMYQIGQNIRPRAKSHYSLYSCRHQFIANMKSLMEPEEVSALAGHAVTKTAKRSYGKSRSAWSPDQLKHHAKPIPDEVATVKQSMDFYKDRVDKLKLAGVYRGNTTSDV